MPRQNVMLKVGYRRARVPEKAEQAHGIQLVRSIGGKHYVIGGHRRHTDFQGTMQTPGIPDVMFFLPPRLVDGVSRTLFLFWECKAVDGRLRREQAEFKALADDAQIPHLVGPLDALIAWLAARGYVKAEAFPHYRQPRTLNPEL